MSESVVIIMRAKNEMPHARRTVEMLHRQTFQEFKLLGIDSGSIDGTLDVLKDHCDTLQQIPPEEYDPGKVLNHAITCTDQDIIVLLNADAVPASAEWLEKLIAPILKHQADATFSRQIARPEARFIVAYDYQRAYDNDKPDSHFFSAAACAFRRELWDRFKFPEGVYAEDSIWATSCRMFNARFQLVKESTVEHSHNYSLDQLFNKRRRHGSGFAAILGENIPLGQRFCICAREILRDLIYACRSKQFGTIPYNIAYRVTIHAGLQQGIREGFR